MTIAIVLASKKREEDVSPASKGQEGSLRGVPHDEKSREVHRLQKHYRPCTAGVSALEEEAVLEEMAACALQECRPRHQTGASIFCKDS